jgi:7-cyano-7-deazaguanine synthase
MEKALIDAPAVVLLSGGVDSATTLAIARAGHSEVYALSFNYGQRHLTELKYAAALADTMRVNRHLVVDIDMRGIGGSALTADIPIPHNDGADMTSGIPVTYVPARNTIFLSFALAWAETLCAPHIFIGVNAIDYSGYPDCRPQFISAFENMANLATKASVEGTLQFTIHTPLIAMTKAQIIKKGTELGVDFALTWSCYDPTSAQMPCGLCDSCVIRQQGFHKAGITDPLIRR